MPMRLSTNDSNFESQFVALLGQKREVSTDVDDAVRAIIADVRTRGDAALAELTLKYDRLDLQRVGLAVTAAEIEAAYACMFERNARRPLFCPRPDCGPS